MLRFAQHDKLGSWIPHFADASVSMTRAVSFRARARNPVWMLRFAQHDKLGSWIPHFADASVSMTSAVSFRARARNPVWMLRFAQHDKLGSWIPHFADASVSMTRAVSFRARARNPVHGCFTSLALRSARRCIGKTLRHNRFNSYPFQSVHLPNSNSQHSLRKT
jgi:hypothetical protein